jgi:hypothetical protein
MTSHVLWRGEKEKVRKYLMPLSRLSSAYPIDCLVELLSLDFKVGMYCLLSVALSGIEGQKDKGKGVWDPGLVKSSDLV